MQCNEYKAGTLILKFVLTRRLGHYNYSCFQFHFNPHAICNSSSDYFISSVAVDCEIIKLPILLKFFQFFNLPVDLQNGFGCADQSDLWIQTSL